jgi:hypothetical protein
MLSLCCIAEYMGQRYYAINIATISLVFIVTENQQYFLHSRGKSLGIKIDLVYITILHNFQYLIYYQTK